jgi:hypothetical protein
MSTAGSIMYKGHKWAKIRQKITGVGHHSHKCETCGALYTEASSSPVKNYACGKRNVKGRYVYRYVPLTLDQNTAWEKLVDNSGMPSIELMELLFNDFFTNGTAKVQIMK